MTSIDRGRALVLWTLAVVTLLTIVAWTLYLARHVLLLVYVSALLAIGFGPLVRLIERQKLLPIGGRRLPRWLAILAVYLAIVGVLVGLGFLVLPALIEQAHGFIDQVPRLVERLQRQLIASGIIGDRLTVGEMVQQAPVGTDTVTTVLTTLWGLIGGILGVVTILILTFYLLVEADDLFAAFVRAFPRAQRAHVRAVAGQIAAKVSAWLSGQLILAAVIGGTAAVGLGLLGVPYFYVLAVLAAVGELIPYLGPLLAAIPAVAVAFTVSSKLAIAVAIFYLLQQQLENHVLVPKIMEHQVGLNAVTVIVAVLIGGSVLGVVGVILAVPTAAIVQVLFQELAPSDGG
jgi:predicted PurR-regulated permease PerM